MITTTIKNEKEFMKYVDLFLTAMELDMEINIKERNVKIEKLLNF